MEKREKKARKVSVPYDRPPAERRSTRSNTQSMKLRAQVEQVQSEKVVEKPSEFSLEVPDPCACTAADLILNPEFRSRRMDRSLEENLLAFLDTSGNVDPDESLEDKLAFLEATHAMCVVPTVAHVPTPKICQAILRFIQDCHSVGLTMHSFQILTDLERRHPRVAIREEMSSDLSHKLLELVVNPRVWSPVEESCIQMSEPDWQLATVSPVSYNLFVLVDTIAKRLRGSEKPGRRKPASESMRCIGKSVVVLTQFLMLQHLMSLIQTDFLCRMKMFDSSSECKNFTPVQESFIYRLLSSCSQQEKKSFLMNLNTIMDPSVLGEQEEGSEDCNSTLCCTKPFNTQATYIGNNQYSTTAALLGTLRDFAQLASSVLVLIMKVDHLNHEFCGTGATSTRRSRFLFDNLLDICSTSRSLDAYLKAVSEPNAKLRFVVDYFINLAPKPVVKRLVDCNPTEYMENLLSCFTDQKILRAVVKVFKEEETLPTLLSHAFQAFLLLHRQQEDNATEQTKGNHQERRTAICKAMAIAMNNLQAIERLEKILPIVEQALFVAGRISCS